MSERRVFSRSLIIWWWLALAASAPLYVRILWEQTALTWRRGPQMIGFSLAHQHPEVIFLGLVGYMGMMSWLVAAGVSALRQRLLPKGVQIAYFIVTVVAALLAFVPYQFWA